MKAVTIGIGRKGWIGWHHELYPKELTHVGAILETEGLELVAVADLDEFCLAEFEDLMPSIPTFTDYGKMLSDVKPDVVTIATPVDTHMKICRNVMRYDSVKAILLEKPVASTVEQAERILMSQRQFKIPIVVNHTRRWHPAWKRAKKEIFLMGGAFHLVGFCNGDPVDAGVHMADLFNGLGTKSTRHTYVNLFDEHLGKYYPYILFELHAFCAQGRVKVEMNGQYVSKAQRYQPSYYKDLGEADAFYTLRQGRGSHGSKRFDYVKSNVKAQLACMAEVRDLALGKRKRPTCSLRDGFKALKLCLSWRDQE